METTSDSVALITFKSALIPPAADCWLEKHQGRLRVKLLLFTQVPASLKGFCTALLQLCSASSLKQSFIPAVNPSVNM